MIIPVSNLTHPSPSLGGRDLEGTLCASESPEYGYLGAVVVAFFILAFYALALWDRWMSLKMREQEKFRRLEEVPSKFSPTSSHYGATLQVPERGNFGNPGPRLADHQAKRPPIRVNDRSCSNQTSLLNSHPKP